MAHVSQKKKEVVKNFSKLLNEYPIVGAVNMENLPAKQLQTMREKLRGKVEILMSKRRLMKISLEESKNEKLKELIPHLKGMPALLFTKENPFSLFKTIKKNKSKAPAKAGQTAPNDIIVPAGATPFAPGPVISELGKFGIKTKIDGGKIHIQEDAIVAKEGNEISGELAGLLTRLDIMPMKVGLDLIAVLEEETIYDKKVLDIDEEQFMANLSNAARWAMNLSCEAVFITKENRDVLIGKAHNDAKGLAISEGILASGLVEDVLAKVYAQAIALKNQVN